nr:hypothetical protein 3 [Prochloraceae cyanobacterium]
MDMHYSEERKGFFSPRVHGEKGMPTDAVKLAEGVYEGWCETGGEIAGVTEAGVLIMAPPPDPVPIP